MDKTTGMIEKYDERLLKILQYHHLYDPTDKGAPDGLLVDLDSLLKQTRYHELNTAEEAEIQIKVNAIVGVAQDIADRCKIHGSYPFPELYELRDALESLAASSGRQG